MGNKITKFIIYSLGYVYKLQYIRDYLPSFLELLYGQFQTEVVLESGEILLTKLTKLNVSY